MTLTPLLPRSKTSPTQLRIDSVRSDERSRQRPSDDLSVGRRHRLDAVLRARCATTRRTRSNPDNDRFVLSKGHAAPILYAAWAEAGSVPARRAAEAAHASIPTSKGIRRRGCRSSMSRPVRSARASARRSGLRSTRAGSVPTYRTYVLLGDGEMAEGSVWEAADVARRITSSTTCAR